MNLIKYRPVGRPNGQVVVVRVTQSKRAIRERDANFNAKYVTAPIADRVMLQRGFVRCRNA